MHLKKAMQHIFILVENVGNYSLNDSMKYNGQSVP
jgi:hypothetical protein